MGSWLRILDRSFCGFLKAFIDLVMVLFGLPSVSLQEKSATFFLYLSK